MKFNLLVLALLGQIDAETLLQKESDIDRADNATKHALAAANNTANASANASANSNDTTWTTTSSSTSTSWSSSSSSSSSWSSSSSSGEGWNSSQWGQLAPPMIETETNSTQESSELGENFGQIKLIGNNDGRTAFIPTTVEPYIKASISVHRDMHNHNSPKRPQGNKRFNKQKYAFVQDNDWVGEMQKFELQRHKTQPNNIWRLVDTTGHCLVANSPQDFKRNKVSSYVTAVFGKKSVCSFWRKVQSGDGWNLVLARPGLSGNQKQYAYMSGWGLSILNNKPSDQEMGPTTSYLVIHKNPKKWSQWSSKVLGAPVHVVTNITTSYMIKQMPVEVEEPANDTNATNATAPAPPAAATPVAAAAPGNATNKSNATNKTKKTRPTLKKPLPVPFAGSDNDEDNSPESADLSYDNDDDDDCDDDDETLRVKIMKSLQMFQTNSGYLDVRWFRCLKLFEKKEDSDDEDNNK